MTTLPILYSFRRCPFAMRARLALYISGITYELREVLLTEKPDEMLVLSSKGTVPVLQLPNGRVIDESLDIMAWALSQNDPERWLEPDPISQNGLINRCDNQFKIHLDRYKYASRYEDCDPLEARDLGERFIAQLEQQLGTGCLFGDGPCQADFAIAPFVRQFALADWDWFFATKHRYTQRWLTTFTNSEAFNAVMDKYDPWKPGDAPIIMNA
ncbi:MAG: glutathione S-transferase [Magnetovibrio sp.]|nr:glutathione S-transferase [Magnetovibrio sp.]